MNIDELDAFLADPIGSRRRRRQQSRDLTPERQQSLLQSMGSGTISGISAVGNLLDLPGSMVRDVAGGITTGDWSAHNPLDQILSPLSDTNRITGRDLNRMWGLTGEEDNWGNFLGGVATEIAFDPATYYTLGASAIGKAGKAAKMAGLGADEVAKVASNKLGRSVGPRTARMNVTPDDLLRARPDTEPALRTALEGLGTTLEAARSEPLGSLARVQLPVFNNIGFNVGKAGNPLAAGAADVLDLAGKAAKASAPVRLGRMLLDPAAGGKYKGLEQDVAERAYRKLPPAIAKARIKYDQVVGLLDKTFEDFEQTVPPSQADQLTRSVFDKMVRHTAERNVDEAYELLAPGAPRNAAMDDAIRSVADEMITAKNAVADEIIGKGGSLELMDAVVSEHFPRFVDPRRTKGYPKRILPTGYESMKARYDEIRELPTEIVNRLLTDSDIMGRNARFTGVHASAHIRNTYGRWLDPNYGAVFDDSGQLMVPGSIDNHAAALADWMQGRKSRDLFTHQTADDFLKHQEGAMRINRSLDAIHEFFADNLSQDGVSLSHAYQKAGLKPDEALAHLAQQRGVSLGEAVKWKVPPEVAQAARSLLEIQTTPGWQQKLEEVVDAVTDTFKGAVTVATAGRIPLPLFPSFFARNGTSGQAVNILSGDIPLTDIPKYVGAVREAGKLIAAEGPRRRGRTTGPPVAAGVDGDYLSEMMHHRVLNDKGFMDIATGMTQSQRTPANPFAVRQTMAEVDEDLLNLPPVAGVPKALRREYLAATRTGGKFNQWVEYFNRAPMFIYLRKKGWTAEAAAAEVKKLQFDYADLTQFEKTYMKRLMPFYAFQRKIASLVAQDLMEKPGGRLAQTLRATNRAQNRDEPLPEYLQKSTAIPLEGTPLESLVGAPPEGNERFLTGFGFAHEAPLSYLAFDPQRPGMSMAGNALYEGASQLNPLLKAPLENMTGQSFFQGGRPLTDIDPGLGRAITNISDTITQDQTYRAPFVGSPEIENLLLSTPLSRVITSTRQAFDPRKSAAAKAVNLGTGLRLHDVSPAAKDTMVKERVDDLIHLLGGRDFKRSYFPDDVKAAMSPEERIIAEELEDLLAMKDREQKERAKKRKKAG